MDPKLAARLRILADDAAIEDLVAAPVGYADGLNNNWWNPPAETRHL